MQHSTQRRLSLPFPHPRPPSTGPRQRRSKHAPKLSARHLSEWCSRSGKAAAQQEGVGYVLAPAAATAKQLLQAEL